MGRRVVALIVAILGVAVAGFTLYVGRTESAWSLVGTSVLAGAALLAAGLALVAVGLAFWIARPSSRSGPLLTGAGFAWFAPELTNPEVGSGIAFTAGLALAGMCPALVAHAVLGYPTGRLGSGAERVAVALVYAAGAALGVSALFTDDRAEGCGDCPPNLLLVVHRPAAADELTRAGLAVGLAASLAVAVLCVRRLLTAVWTARLMSSVAALYQALVGALAAVFLDRFFLANGTFERRLWLGQALALVGLAAAVGWGLFRARRARGEVAQLVVELAQSPPPGGLRDALARTVGDPDLLLAYPLEDRLVDGEGRPVELPPGRPSTTLVRAGRPVAVIAHAPGVLEDEQLVEEMTAAASLALENERLQAEVRARLDELRASRARIVEAGDAERRRLERDLHDGAQQRLVGLSLSLRMLRTQSPAAQLERADEQLRLAIVELRDLAHGIFPAVLADEGLAAAVEALAEEAHVPLRIGPLAEGRLAAPVETAAYTIVGEVVRAARSPVDVRTHHAGTALALDLETAAVDGIDVVALEDRVGALDGRLSIGRDADGRVHVHAELPCAS